VPLPIALSADDLRACSGWVKIPIALKP